jgi:hypothetical protein
MTSPTQVVDPARAVRRIAIVALTAVAIAAGVALALGLHHVGPQPVANRTPSIFPATLTDRGFFDGRARLVSARTRPASTSAVAIDLTVPVGTTVYVVGRCDAGSLHLVVEGTRSDGACSAGPVGVMALEVTRPSTHITAAVSARQHSWWGLAIYR